MASFIDPRCAIPVYLLENEGVAGECGKLEGFIISFILSIGILVISISLYRRELKDANGQVIKKDPLKHFGITALTIFLIWVLIPMGTSWLKKVDWRGYTEQIKSFKTKGFSDADAIKQIQSMRETQIQASAITRGASTIATAMQGTRSPNYMSRSKLN